MRLAIGFDVGGHDKGFYTTSLLDAYARGRTSRGQDLSETVKLVLLLGDYLHERYHGRYYAKAQNVTPALRAAYDEALADADVLLMPTLPMKATLLPDPAGPRKKWVARALEMIPNTAPFDVTGHPGPAGRSNGYLEPAGGSGGPADLEPAGGSGGPADLEPLPEPGPHPGGAAKQRYRSG